MLDLREGDEDHLTDPLEPRRKVGADEVGEGGSELGDSGLLGVGDTE